MDNGTDDIVGRLGQEMRREWNAKSMQQKAQWFSRHPDAAFALQGTVPPTADAYVQGADQHAYYRKHHFVTGPIRPGTRGWKGAWILGQGGYGMAGLWVQLDEDDNVIDRIVGKQVQLGPAEYWDFTFWKGRTQIQERANGVDLVTLDHTAPMEGSITQDVGDNPHIVNYRGRTEFDRQNRSYKIFTGYAPHGDLLKLIERYQMNGQHFPEPFLWYVLLALARAATHLVDENGTITVHRDIKPGNVFFDEPANAHWKRYPKPLLADFGFAFQTTENDQLNPHLYNDDKGTDGFLAPEQRIFRSKKDGKLAAPMRLGIHTNIWQIGATVWCMMYNRPHGPAQLSYGSGNQMLPFARTGYSPQLRELIKRCTHLVPDKRPTLQEIITECESPANTKNMDSAEPDGDDEDDDDDDNRGDGLTDEPPGMFFDLPGMKEEEDVGEEREDQEDEVVSEDQEDDTEDEGVGSQRDESSLPSDVLRTTELEDGSGNDEEEDDASGISDRERNRRYDVDFRRPDQWAVNTHLTQLPPLRYHDQQTRYSLRSRS